MLLRLLRPLRFALLVAALVPALSATSVVPPSFPELVAEADAIYAGRVTTVEARKLTAPDGSPLIKTFVTFAVERVLKGTARESVTLELLGGRVGDEQLRVSGMPIFAVGDRDFVFVQRNGVQYCPLVALGHGRYRVLRDQASGRDYVARDNRRPLAATSDVELPLHGLPAGVAPARAAAPAAALSPDAFAAEIAAEVARVPAVRARL
jgi:hypothetical protein